MKKILPLIMLCLISCGHKKTDLERRADEVRKENADRLKRIEQDSILQVSDSLAAIAWGDALFSMTREELMNTKTFGGGVPLDYGIEMNHDKLKRFKDKYDLPFLESIKAYIVNEALSYIFIYSKNVEPRDFTKLERECIIFKNEFYRIYGQPKSTKDASMTDFDSDGNQSLASFNVKGHISKDITIELKKDGYYYSYFISIYGETSRKRLSRWIENHPCSEDIALSPF